MRIIELIKKTCFLRWFSISRELASGIWWRRQQKHCICTIFRSLDARLDVVSTSASAGKPRFLRWFRAFWKFARKREPRPVKARKLHAYSSAWSVLPYHTQLLHPKISIFTMVNARLENIKKTRCFRRHSLTYAVVVKSAPKPRCLR